MRGRRRIPGTACVLAAGAEVLPAPSVGTRPAGGRRPAWMVQGQVGAGHPLGGEHEFHLQRRLRRHERRRGRHRSARRRWPRNCSRRSAASRDPVTRRHHALPRRPRLRPAGLQGGGRPDRAASPPANTHPTRRHPPRGCRPKVSRGSEIFPGSTSARCRSCRRIAGSTADQAHRPRRHGSSASTTGPRTRPRSGGLRAPAGRAVAGDDPGLPRPHPLRRQADSRRWIAALDSLRWPSSAGGGARPRADLDHRRRDLQLTRDYLPHLRQTMGEAGVTEPFEEAYAGADWSRFDKLPAVPDRQSHQRLQHLSADGHEVK